ncbi:MAG TPA: insulinase family protein [candidate division Zixibacteria bacterium]|nr:insulinase family protein [candidate division Zixibacteria bacterium]
MKKIFLISIIILAAFAFVSAQEGISPASKVIANMKFPELSWKVPEVGKDVTRTVLPNGIIVYLKEDHTLPIINAHAMVKAGEIYDSKADMEIGDLTGTLMRAGGTKSFTPDSLNTLLEFISGSVESGIGTESGSVSMSVMSKDLDIGLKIFNEVIRFPTFDTAKISLEKSQIKEGIRRRNDRPGGIIWREFSRVIYGDHPYGRILEWDNVKNISRDDLIRYHEKYFHSNNTMISFSGDFNTKELVKKLDKLFGDWKKSDVALPPIPPVDYVMKPGVYVIEKQLTQTNISVGQLGIKRDNPDRYAIALMNFTLGGGSFTSRLTSKVRSDEGLAYSVGSSFNISGRDYGTFAAYAQTKTASTHRVLEIFMQEFKRIREELASQQEFETARDAYINNYVFQFDSPDEVVDRLMSLEFDGYPLDYYQKYLENIRSVTREDMKRVAEKYLKPDQMTIMVLGDTTKMVGDLKDFGPVQNIKLEEPKVE